MTEDERAILNSKKKRKKKKKQPKYNPPPKKTKQTKTKNNPNPHPLKILCFYLNRLSRIRILLESVGKLKMNTEKTLIQVNMLCKKYIHQQ